MKRQVINHPLSLRHNLLDSNRIVRTIKTDSIIITPIDPTGKHLSYPNEDIKAAVQIDDANTIQLNNNTLKLRR